MQTGWRDPTDKLVPPSLYSPPDPVSILALRDDVVEIKGIDLNDINNQISDMSEQVINVRADVNLINADYPPRITALETTSASHTSLIAGLTNRVTTAEGTITNIDGEIEGMNIDIASLQSNKASQSDLTALTTRVGTDESNISSNTTNIQTNITAINTQA